MRSIEAGNPEQAIEAEPIARDGVSRASLNAN